MYKKTKKTVSKILALSLALGFSFSDINGVISYATSSDKTSQKGSMYTDNIDRELTWGEIEELVDVTNEKAFIDAIDGAKEGKEEYKYGYVPSLGSSIAMKSNKEVVTNAFGASSSDKKLDPRKNPNAPNTQSDIITPVKDQAYSGTCWAFAAMSSVESDVLINKNQVKDFSEIHMGNNVSKRTTINTGGNIEQSFAYLTMLRGPQDESILPSAPDLPISTGWVDSSGNPVAAGAPGAVKDPYDIDSTSADGVSVNVTMPGHKPFDGKDDKSPEYRLTKMKVLNYDIDEIKKNIVEHGSVFAGFWIEQNVVPGGGGGFLSDDQVLYDYPAPDKGNHAVSLVGWDDDIKIGTQTGAWLVKNSWGEENGGAPYGEYGYHWMTYRSFDEGGSYAVFAGMENDMNDIKSLYSDDYFPSYSQWVSPYQSPVLADVYTKKSNDDETITDIGINLRASKPYDYKIYVTKKDEFKNTTDKSKWGTLVASGTTDFSGYHEVKLDQSVSLKGNAGDEFAIIYEIDGEVYTPIIVDENEYNASGEASISGSSLLLNTSTGKFEERKDPSGGEIAGGSTIKVLTRNVAADVEDPDSKDDPDPEPDPDPDDKDDPKPNPDPEPDPDDKDDPKPNPDPEPDPDDKDDPKPNPDPEPDPDDKDDPKPNPDPEPDPDDKDDPKPNPDPEPDPDDKDDPKPNPDPEPDPDDKDDPKPDDNEGLIDGILKLIGYKKPVEQGSSVQLYPFFKSNKDDKDTKFNVSLLLEKLDDKDGNEDNEESTLIDDGFEKRKANEFNWELTGNTDKESYVDETGLVHIGKNEEAEKVSVKASFKEASDVFATQDIDIEKQKDSGSKDKDKDNKDDDKKPNDVNDKDKNKPNDGNNKGDVDKKGNGNKDEIGVNKSKSDDINIDNSTEREIVNNITEKTVTKKIAPKKSKLQKPLEKPMQNTGVINTLSNVNGSSLVGMLAAGFIAFVSDIFRKKK